MVGCRQYLLLSVSELVVGQAGVRLAESGTTRGLWTHLAATVPLLASLSCGVVAGGVVAGGSILSTELLLAPVAADPSRSS